MSQPGSKQCRIVYDFQAEDKTELNVQENSIVTLYEADQAGDGWSYVVREDGNAGYVPTTHIEDIDDFPIQDDPGLNRTPRDDSLSSDSSSDDEQADPVHKTATTVTSSQAKIPEKKPSSNANQTIVAKTLIKRTAFSNSGAETFLRGEEAKINRDDLQEYEKYIIMMINGVLVWKPAEDLVTYRIGSTETDSKFAGAKSYTNYKIHPSNGDSKGIRRRFKQFDWLYERLTIRFPTLGIPKLPPKTVRGRFNEDIVQMRKDLLETWLNRLARHPIISDSQLFSGFLKMQDQIEWKKYKRTMEKDPANQSGFFARTEIVSDFNHSLDAMQEDINGWEKLTKNLSGSMSYYREVLQHHSTDFARYHQNEFTTVGKAITNLSSFFQPEHHYPLEFNLAVKAVGDCFIASGKAFHDKQIQDAVPLRKGLEEYINIVSSQKHSHSVAKDTLKKLKEAKKHHQETAISDKCATVYATVEAEMNHFQQESVRDISDLMIRYLRHQLLYHKNMTRKFEESLESFMRFSGKSMNSQSPNFADVPSPPATTTAPMKSAAPPPPPPPQQSAEMQQNSF